MNQISFILALLLAVNAYAFSPVSTTRATYARSSLSTHFRMAVEESTETSSPVADGESTGTEEEQEELDAGTLLQLEKQRRADELRSQEVFMKRSTGIHQCTVCDWEFDEKKGDSFMIGGLVKPDTPFADLPSNYRCPTCRASKDQFQEVTETIPGFEVNQGYGLGTNSMTSGQKNLLVFGGLGAFFVLFLGGYALS
mmetsp:Transcript_7456/g.10692  ORF Transcript_7456/g.10692 Transcript_7456/m.10692 type:complete len:197 (-) Transcript_7456:328-918(-)